MTPSTKAIASLYISKELRDKAQAIATQRRRSFSEYVCMLIERDLREIENRKLAEAEVTE